MAPLGLGLFRVKKVKSVDFVHLPKVKLSASLMDASNSFILSLSFRDCW